MNTLLPILLAALESDVYREHNEVVQLERPLGLTGTQQALIFRLTRLLPAIL